MKKRFTGCVVEKCIHISAVFTAFDKVFQENFYFGGETHDFWELVCVIDGTAGVTAGEDVYVLERGQAILHRPMEFHRLWSEKKTTPRIIVVSFAGDIMPVCRERRLNLTAQEIQRLCASLSEIGDIFDMEKDIVIRKIKIGMEAQAHLFVSMIEEMILSSSLREEKKFDLLESTGAANYRTIVRVLEEHIGDHLSLGDTARLCGMSESSIKKTFSRYAGIGMMAYFNQMKMRYAARLLEEGMNIRQAAEAVGFADPNYFSTVFKRVHGVAPGMYLNLKKLSSKSYGNEFLDMAKY